MNKIKSFEELNEFVNKFKSNLILRENFSKDNLNKRDILVCGGTGCTSSNSLEIIDNLKNEVENAGLSDKVEVQLTGCFGFCAKGPIVKVYPDNIFYVQVKPEDAHEIIESHIINNKVVERLLFEEPSLNHKKVEKHDEMSFYKKQYRIALRNCGHINPENINESSFVTLLQKFKHFIVFFLHFLLKNAEFIIIMLITNFTNLKGRKK